MNIGWPEGIYLGLSFFMLAFALGMHGQPKGNWNGGAVLFGLGCELALLWWGGFFH